LTTFALAGIVEAVIGSLKDHQVPEQRAWLFANAQVAFLLETICAIVFALLVLIFFFDGSNLSMLTYASVLCGGTFLALASFHTQIVRLEEKHLLSVLFLFAPAFGGFIGGFVAVFFERTAGAFFIGSAAGILLPLLGLSVSHPYYKLVVVRSREIRKILWRAAPFIGIAILGWLGGYGNNYIIDYIFMHDDVAKFTFALSLSSVMLLISVSLNQVWSPRFYRMIHERPFKEVERYNRTFFRLVSLVLGFVGGMVIVVFSWVLALFGGNLLAYQYMNLELSLLFAGYVVLIPWWQCCNHLLAHAMGTSMLNITLITSAIGICVWVVLMYLLGSIGIYLGFFIQMIVRSIGIFLAARRNWPVNVSWAGILTGLFMISIGFVFASLSITTAVAVVFYFLIAIALIITFFRHDFVRLVIR